MPKNWTPSQLEAITSQGCDLLVSAGAGSGKTAVLTERIIRRLTDPKQPAEITRMLIVTFTKAAAGELKERISAALTEALAQNPGNKRLSRQLLQLDHAKVCTIHSFCLELLRANSTELGIGADFRVADEAEIKLLRRSLMDELIDDYFEGKVPAEAAIADFGDFTDLFCGTKGDEKLAETFLSLDETFSSYRHAIGFIADFAAELEADAAKDFAESRCGMEILSLVQGRLGSYYDTFVAILPELMDDPKLSKAYLPAFTYDADYLRDITRLATERNYTGLSAHLNGGYSPVRLGAVRGAELSAEIENAKLMRDAFKKERDRLAAKFFSLTPEQITANQRETAAILRKLHRLLSLFTERFADEKRRRSLVDFGDLERLAAGLLVGEDGRRTKTAAAIAGQFDEIYIDEYQDTNALQDAIFAAVSNGANRFMVGDVKQSIYAFRGAEPGIFQSYRRDFARRDPNEILPGSGKTVFLSDNFRCDQPVIDFANLVSERIFTNGTGALPYYLEDNLLHSKTTDELGTPVVISLIDKDSDEEDDDMPLREAEYIASEIEALLANGKKDDGSPLKPSDIAILSRSARAHSEAFSTVFAKHAIPFYNNVGGDFFENAEVLLALCVLSVIDNPTRDIYLAGALKSPVWGFTLDELIAIRRHVKDGCLYDALKAYAAETKCPKCERFFADLTRYRRKAEELPVDRLIWYLYTDTKLPALVGIASDGSQRRRANLTLLYEYARRYEGSSFKGLYNFLRYINDIIAGKARLENAKIFGSESETVKLMTIHQSKGLEFPVVFVCGCAKKFNESDLKQNIVVERELGIAMKLSDTTGFARYDTPIRQAIVKRLADAQLEEEMRVLYVAMTRARERLYLTGLVNKPDDYLEKLQASALNLSRSAILQNGGYMRWILLALFNKDPNLKGSGYRLIVKTTETDPAVSEPETISPTENIPASNEKQLLSDSIETTIVSEPGETPDWPALLRDRFDFVYPRAHGTKIPAKLSVSKLFPEVLDDDGSAPLDQSDEKPIRFTPKVPLFLSGEEADSRVTAAERGTATHLFMQFCDFTRLKKVPVEHLPSVIEDECARLREYKFITPRSASLVNQNQLVDFFTSRIFSEICASHEVHREHRFNVKLPAKQFTADPLLAAELENEFILVQGVMDCFFENPDGTLTILDYKTDVIPKGMTRTDAEKRLLERHGLQLSYYKTACEKISAKKVARCLIYSFALSDTVAVPIR